MAGNPVSASDPRASQLQEVYENAADSGRPLWVALDQFIAAKLAKNEWSFDDVVSALGLLGKTHPTMALDVENAIPRAEALAATQEFKYSPGPFSKDDIERMEREGAEVLAARTSKR